MGRRLMVVGLLCLALVVGVSVAWAGKGPATTIHVVDMPFFDPAGIDCATGNETDNTGVLSGVIHTVAKPNGGFHISGNFHGSATNDDDPADGVPEATTTFVSHFNDIFHASGGEVHNFGLHGEGKSIATGAGFRFDAVLHLVLDPDGNPKVDITSIVCK